MTQSFDEYLSISLTFLSRNCTLDVRFVIVVSPSSRPLTSFYMNSDNFGSISALIALNSSLNVIILQPQGLQVFGVVIGHARGLP